METKTQLKGNQLVQQEINKTMLEIVRLQKRLSNLRQKMIRSKFKHENPRPEKIVIIPKHFDLFIQKACEYYQSIGYNVTPEVLMHKSRIRELIYLRSLVYYVIHRYHNFTYVQIGAYFAKHHSTIVHAVQIIDDELAIYTNENTQKHLNNLSELFEESVSITYNNENNLLTLQSQQNQ